MTTPPMIPQRHPFVKAIASALRQHCGLSATRDQGPRLIVATSGGADSVALLRTLAVLSNRRTWRLQLAVGHVQHHLRPEAEVDAAFVRGLADRLGLPFMRADLDLSTPNGNLEAHARRARYQALAEMAHEFDASCVVTAHHGDDQLETLLMRILRGSSVRGLSGMAWRRRLTPQSGCVLIRPMLAVNRNLARQFLTEINQSWRQDHTNADVSRLRARLRHEVLPVLHAIRPDAPAKAVALTDHLRQIDQLIETQTNHQYDQRVICHGQTTELSRSDGRRMPEVVLIALLRRLLVEAGVNPDRLGRRVLGPIVRAVRDHQGGERAFEPGCGVRLILTRDRISITRRILPA